MAVGREAVDLAAKWAETGLSVSPRCSSSHVRSASPSPVARTEAEAVEAATVVAVSGVTDSPDQI